MKEQPDYLRQLDWFDPAKHNVPVTVVGAGGIGGPTVLALAKLGVSKLKVYDFDRVEAHNQPNQLYGLADIKRHKVDSLQKLVARFADVRINVSRKKFTQYHKPMGVVISAVDSMDARRAIWSAVKASKDVQLYIDGRIGGEVVRVLVCRPLVKSDVKNYENTLVKNHAVVPLKCTAAGIIDVSFSVAALITRAFRLAITGRPKYSDLFYDHRNLIFQKD